MVRRALLLTGRVIAVLVAVIALSVCALAAFQWVRGYWVVDVAETTVHRDSPAETNSTTYRISSGRGIVAFNLMRNRSFWSSPRSAGAIMPRPPPRVETTTLKRHQFYLQDRTIWQKMGFNAYRRIAPVRTGGITFYSGGRASTYAWQSSDWGLRLPYWLIVPATGIPPLLYLRRVMKLRRRLRLRRGLCGACGYDLRASTGRCPECGEAITPPPASPPTPTLPPGAAA